MALEERIVERRLRAGFSLLELSVVLAIISVVVVFGVDIGRNAMSGSDRISTQEKLQVIKQALENYADRNGYLPCPAAPGLTPDSTNFGFEQRSGTAGAGCTTGNGVVATAGNTSYIGAVPTRTLGLSDTYISDAWNSKFTYAMSGSHSGTTLNGMNSYYNGNGTIIVRGGTLANNYPLTTLPDGTSAANATFVVFSHGKNVRGAFGLYDTTNTDCSPVTFIEDENCDRANLTYYDATYNEGGQTATRFDDYVVWGSNVQKRNPAVVPTTSCPTDPGGNPLCETWCAPCTSNVHGSSTVPAAPTRLCAKFITSNTPCEATCVWPGASLPCP